MGKVFKDGVWIVTRDDTTPDSERHIERDDPLFPSLQVLFQGQETHVDFAKIAAKHASKPEDVFINIHENYGYVCIGTGENPAFGEKLTDEEKEKRKQSIKQALEAANIPHVLIKGKYMGVEEDSYFVPFNDKKIGLASVLQGAMIKKIEQIATTHRQDSLLICQGGQACYLYTYGPDKGKVITGKSAIVYPGKEKLPNDCYSLFLGSNDSGIVGFTCALNFNQTYANIQQYVDEVNNARKENYKDFTLAPVAASKVYKQKQIILLRGTNGYNDYAVEMKTALEYSGKKVAIFGTDANIAKINDEIALDNAADQERTQGEGIWWLYNESKANWQWPDIRNEFIKRNTEIYQSLLKSDVDVIIFADMNKIADFMKPYIEAGKNGGHEVISNVVNSFAFNPVRSDFVEKLCNQFGNFMARHVGEFKSEKGQINETTLKVGNLEIIQQQNLTAAALAVKLSLSQHNQTSIVALNSGLAGTLLGGVRSLPAQQEESKTLQPQSPSPIY